MSNAFDTASQWLDQQLKRFGSSEAVYRRAGRATVVMVQAGSSDIEIDDGAGGTLAARTRDFVVDVDDLGDLMPPTVGDKIEFCGAVCEVLPTTGGSCWRWSDEFNRTVRVHCKDVAAT